MNQETGQWLDIVEYLVEDSLGSAFEWETQLVVARNINYISEGKFKLFEDKIIQLQKMISRFQDRLS